MEEQQNRFNPFPGLRSFEPDEDHLFFGRDTQVDDLLGRLGRTRFLAVVGASGSGKSSLVRSGLIPSLHSGYMAKAGSSWRMAIFRPGEDPIGNLAAALGDGEVLGGADEDADMRRSMLEATLHRSALGLAECVRQARLPEHDCVLVLADQFEELFRFKGNRRIRDSREAALAFVKLLLEGAKASDVPLYVVITMRSDFIGNCTEFPGLVEAINEGQYLVPRMTREERRQAIEGPVAVGGGEVSQRLVTRLLNDVGDNPDQLPILQHALMRAWDFWAANHLDDEPLDLRHYEAIGTLKEALSLHAEEAYRDLDSERLHKVCEQLFKALTDRGSDSRGTRRPIRLGEACEIAEATAEEVVLVAESFRQPGRTFLMPAYPTPLHDDSILDISHESLMRTWERLIQWVDAEARSAQVYLRLSQNAARYQEGKAALYRDPELQLALNWREESRPTSAWAQRYDPAFERAVLYLDYSEKERAQEITEKERRRRRGLRRMQILASVFGAATLLFLLMGLVVMNLKVKADQSAEEAQKAQKEAEVARHEAEDNAEQARFQARLAEERREQAELAQTEAETQREAATTAKTVAERQRQRAQQQEEEARRQKTEADSQRQKAVAARQEAEIKQALAVAARQEAEISEAEARRLRRVALARALAVQTTRLQSDQAELAALLALASHQLNQKNGGESEDPNIYTALRISLGQLDPHLQTILRHHTDAIRAVALGEDGRMAVAGSNDGSLSLMDLEARAEKRPKKLKGLDSPIRSLAVSRGHIAAGSLSGRLLLWSRTDLEVAPKSLKGHDKGVAALAFRPGDASLASGGADARVHLWDTADPKRPVQTLKARGKVTSLAFFQGGNQLAASTAKGILLWDMSQSSPEPKILGEEREILSISVDAAGRRLASGTEEGTVELWKLDGPRHQRTHVLRGHSAGVTSLSFSSRSRLASGSRDGSVRLWDVDHPDAEPIVLPDHSSWVWAVALQPQGDEIVSGSADRTIRVWSTKTAALASKICPRVSRNLTRGEWGEYLGNDVEYVRVCPDLPKRTSAQATRQGES